MSAYCTSAMEWEEAYDAADYADVFIVSCGVCGDRHPEDLTVKVSRCGHRLCRACAVAYILTMLKTPGHFQFNCPVEKCSNVLHFEDARRMRIQPREIREWERWSVRKVMEEPGWRSCVKEGCGGGVWFDVTSALFTCPKCDLEQCGLCRREAHGEDECSVGSTPSATYIQEYDAATESLTLRLCPDCGLPSFRQHTDHQLVAVCSHCSRSWYWESAEVAAYSSQAPFEPLEETTCEKLRVALLYVVLLATLVGAWPWEISQFTAWCLLCCGLIYAELKTRGASLSLASIGIVPVWYITHFLEGVSRESLHPLLGFPLSFLCKGIFLAAFVTVVGVVQRVRSPRLRFKTNV